MAMLDRRQICGFVYATCGELLERVVAMGRAVGVEAMVLGDSHAFALQAERLADATFGILANPPAELLSRLPLPINVLLVRDAPADDDTEAAVADLLRHAAGAVLRVGPLTLDVVRRLVTLQGKELPLRRLLFNTLRALMACPDPCA